jgi:hypothetical protein
MIFRPFTHGLHSRGGKKFNHNPRKIGLSGKREHSTVPILIKTQVRNLDRLPCCPVQSAAQIGGSVLHASLVQHKTDHAADCICRGGRSFC